MRAKASIVPSQSACCALLQMLGVLGVFALFVGCSQTKPQTAMSAHVGFPSSVRILLLEPDIEVSELTAGGNVVPNAAWTRQAKDNVGTALNHLMATRNAVIVPYSSPEVVDPYDEETQLLKLHSAVGASILIAPAIPTRKDRFDWSMGPDVQMLGDAYDADYALFVYFRDSFATAGRKAIQFMAAFVGYYGVSGGSQFGFASLVNLRTGQVVWFNQFRSGSGDLTDISPAREATEDLLADFPIPQGAGAVAQSAEKTGSEVKGQETANVGQPTVGPSTDLAAIRSHDGTYRGIAVFSYLGCRASKRRFDLQIIVENNQIRGGDQDGMLVAEGKVGDDGRLIGASLNGYLLMEGSLAKGTIRMHWRDCGAHYELSKI